MPYEESIGLRLTSDANDFITGTNEATGALGQFASIIKGTVTDALGDFVARQRRLEHSLGSIGKSIDWVNRRVGAAFIAQAVAGTMAARSANNYQQSLKAISFMAKKTYRDVNAINAVIERQATGLASKGMLAEAMQDLMQTKLTVKQMEDVIKVAKNAAALKPWVPMQQQLRSIASGIRQLNGNLIDNFVEIGRLDNVYAKFARTLNKSSTALTVQEKQQAIVNAMLTTGSAIMGQHEKALQDGALAHQIWKRNLSDINVMLGEKALPIYRAYGKVMVGVTDTMKMTIRKSSRLRDALSKLSKDIGLTGFFIALGDALVYPFQRLAQLFAQKDFGALVKDQVSSIAAPFVGLGLMFTRAAAAASIGFATLGAVFKAGFSAIGIAASVGFAATVVPAVTNAGKAFITAFKAHVLRGGKGWWAAVKEGGAAAGRIMVAAYKEETDAMLSVVGASGSIEKYILEAGEKAFKNAKAELSKTIESTGKFGGVSVDEFSQKTFADAFEREASLMAAKNTKLIKLIPEAIFGKESMELLRKNGRMFVSGIKNIVFGLRGDILESGGLKRGLSQTKTGFKELGSAVKGLYRGMKSGYKFSMWGTTDKAEIKKLKQLKKLTGEIFEESKKKLAEPLGKLYKGGRIKTRNIILSKMEQVAQKRAMSILKISNVEKGILRGLLKTGAELTVGASGIERGAAFMLKALKFSAKAFNPILWATFAIDITQILIDIQKQWRAQIAAVMD